MTRRILCATDGSDHAARAVSHATELARQGGGTLTFIAVNTMFMARGAPTTLMWEKDEIHKILETAAATAKEAGIEDVTCAEAESRDVASAIVGYAEQKDIDQIIVGSGDRSILSRLLIGSVSSEVARKAHCTVTIVR